MHELLKKAEQYEILAEDAFEEEERKALLLDAADIYVAFSKICQQQQAPHFVAKAKECYLKSLQPMQKIKPLILSEKKLSFADIAGLDDVKEKIRLKIIEPFLHPDYYSYFKKKIGGGILMYGPPGCGKTLVAEAAAHEAGCTFFYAQASELASKYVGETEKNIARLFAQAREAAPAIIFFDELEALGSERNHAPNYQKSAVSQLLVEINGLGNKEQQILLIGATNEPWNVDLALRRAGRFGSPIFVPPPDLKGRYVLLKNYLKDKPLAGDVTFLPLAIETEGYSGADVVELCDGAIECALRDSLLQKKMRNVCMDDFIACLHSRKNVTASWFKLAMDELQKNHDDTFNEIVAYGQKYCLA